MPNKERLVPMDESFFVCSCPPTRALSLHERFRLYDIFFLWSKIVDNLFDPLNHCLPDSGFGRSHFHFVQICRHESLSIFFLCMSENPKSSRPRLAAFLFKKESIAATRTTKKQCAGTVFLYVVRPPGIEPGTFSLKGSCSTG